MKQQAAVIEGRAQPRVEHGGGMVGTAWPWLLVRLVLCVVILASPGTAALAAPAGQTSARHIDLVFADQAESSFMLAARQFKSYVESKSGGALQVTLHPAGRWKNQQLGELQLAHAVSASGTLPMAILTAAPLSNYNNELEVLDVPFIFRNYSQVDHVLDGPIGERLMMGLTKHGLRGLAFLDCGFRIFTSSKPIRKMADFRNLRIRVMQTRLFVNLVKALDAVPVPSSVEKIHEMARKGYIDAADRSYPTWWDYRLYEVQPYVADTGHAYSAKIFVINEKFYQALSPKERALLKQAALAARIPQRAAFRAEVTRVRSQARSKGAQIHVFTAVDRQAFIKACQPVVEQASRLIGPGLIREVQAVQ